MQTPNAEALDLIDYVDRSPTPFHAVTTAVERLEAAGFSALREETAWTIAAGAKHYVVRNGSSIVAFIAGQKPPSESGFSLIGAHTDSPNLRVKPNGDIVTQGYRSTSVEIYGGVLLTTWTDRDLGIAGRVFVRNSQGHVTPKNVLVRRPVARVPQLAIHLDREVNERGLILNKEVHMRPVWGVDQGRGFLDFLAKEVGAVAEQIASFELMFFDVTPPVIGGADGDFIYSARLDNLASCHAALAAIIAAKEKTASRTRLAVLYDNEEIGSETHQGAGGTLLGDVMARITLGLDKAPEATYRAKARSFMLSSDMAHAIHPNYGEKHDGLHAPRLNQGPVLKINANARYATDAESMAVFQSFARDAEVPLQRFVMRSDMACGSTIGPIVSTREGVKTVDIGNPMLSMHSCREMCGAADQAMMIRVMKRFFGV